MKHATVLLIVLVLAVALPLPVADVSAAVYEVGVKTGQWAEYSVLGGWDVSPSDANALMPQAIRDARNTEFINMSVETASLKTATLARTTQFRNNTRAVALISGDVETGAGTLNFTVISRGLEVGDNVVDNPSMNVRIKLTERRTYAGAERTVNYANQNESTVTSSRWYEFRWDKATGLMVAMRLLQEDVTSEFSAISSILITMKRTNIWESEGSNPFDVVFRFSSEILVVCVIATAAILTGYVVFRKPKRGREWRRLKTRAYASMRL